MKKLIFLFSLLSAMIVAHGFQSDELLVGEEEEDEFGLEGLTPSPTREVPPSSPPPSDTIPKRRKSASPSNSDSDSKVHFSIDHAFGSLDSDFSLAGNFSARLKSTHSGSPTLIKLRFSRNPLSDEEKHKFQKLLEDDDFYRIKLPSNILNPLDNEFVTSSVKARCLSHHSLDEHIAIHIDGTNILGVTYGSHGTCAYPRQFKLPVKWSFNSHTVLKYAEVAPRKVPLFTEAVFGGPDGVEEEVKQPEKSFWAKYWMYLVPLGFVMMNAMTQAMNMPEEQGQGAGPAQRGPASAVRRR